MAKIKIPADTSKLKEAFKNALKKKAAPASVIKDPLAKARAEREAAARVKAKELKAELENTKLSQEEKDAKIAELGEQLRIVTEERDKFKPLAEQMQKFDHVERTKLLEKLPPEERKAAKELPLAQLRTYTKAFTGTSGTAITTTAGAKTEEELFALAEKNPDEFLKQVFKEEKKA